MKLMDISEVSKQTGIAASAIRHYEEKGLITSVGRRGLKRLFGPEVLDQLALITLGTLTIILPIPTYLKNLPSPLLPYLLSVFS